MFNNTSSPVTTWMGDLLNAVFNSTAAVVCRIVNTTRRVIGVSDVDLVMKVTRLYQEAHVDTQVCRPLQDV